MWTFLKALELHDAQRIKTSSHIWEWRHRWHIHYQKAGSENTGAPALLLLPGFGVGSFHYEQQLQDFGQEYRVWALDFIGQGKSWPSHDPAPLEVVEENIEAQVNASGWGFGPVAEPWAAELAYSVDLWREQVQSFVDQVYRSLLW
jgi:pimeloyl-ACP methyl ester carboxylesterase